MGHIWVKEFPGGLDTRKDAATASGTTLAKAENGHITRGAKFEKRFSFDDAYDLPTGDTVGLAATATSLVAFGHGAAPTMPSGVTYQQLVHPTVPATALSRVLSTDLYKGLIYAVGEFADGSVHHFYDGTNVTDWFDGRARAQFEITGGSVTAATAATGSFEVTGGASGGADTITAVTVDGVNLLGSPVVHTSNNATTAAAVAAEITSHTSSPDYTATSDGQVVTISASVTGPTANGKAITTTVTGGFTTASATTMSGGANAISSEISDIKVNGVSIIASAISWATSNTATATAVAAAIDAHTSSPDYDGSSAGSIVSIAAQAAAGSGPNGFDVEITLANGLVVDPASGLTMADGADASGTFQPGEFVRTINTKMYSVSGPLLHFSGIKEPTKFTTDTTGAGFIDLSQHAAGAEKLKSLARYQNLLAVFAERQIQIWFIDPDPDLYRPTQTLNNIGTVSPHSVVEFGDVDVYFLDWSGVRSLRSRSSINVASTTDVGIPIDDLVRAKIDELTEDELTQVFGLIEPRFGRLWLVMKDTIFVFSYFPGSKISAWTTYLTTDASGDAFAVEAVAIFDRRVYLRAGDTIYCYGGVSTGVVYDDTVATAITPYLDGDDPSREKTFNGFDAAVKGQWDVSMSLDPVEEIADATFTEYFTVPETTYKRATLPLDFESTHVAVKFESSGSGACRLSAFALHFDGDDDED